MGRYKRKQNRVFNNMRHLLITFSIKLNSFLFSPALTSRTRLSWVLCSEQVKVELCSSTCMILQVPILIKIFSHQSIPHSTSRKLWFCPWSKDYPYLNQSVASNKVIYKNLLRKKNALSCPRQFFLQEKSYSCLRESFCPWKASCCPCKWHKFRLFFSWL